MSDLRAWIVEFADSEDFSEWARGAAAVQLIDAVDSMARGQFGIPDHSFERFIWNLQYAAGEIVWHESWPEPKRKELIRNLMTVLCKAFNQHSQPSPATFNFWDALIEVYEREGRPDSAKAVHDELYFALCQQLRVREEGLQMSALHGLNHLRDVRATDYIESAAGDFASTAVIRYADEAKRFRSA